MLHVCIQVSNRYKYFKIQNFSSHLEALPIDIAQGNEGADASAIQTSLIPGQSDGSEEQRSALERWLDEDWHELPAITLDVSLRVMEFAQRASQQVKCPRRGNKHT